MDLSNHAHMYRTLFQRTNGFVLNWPIGTHVCVGDFFTIKSNKFNVVGNIRDKSMELSTKHPFVLDDYVFYSPVLEPSDWENSGWEKFEPPAYIWNMERGCSSDYKSKHILHAHKHKIKPAEVNKYITRFDKEGDFFFSAKNIGYMRMRNFEDLYDQIIRRLATDFFNYSEIYLVLEVAHIEKYSMGISRSQKAELIVSLEKYFNGDILELMSSSHKFVVEESRGFRYLKIQEPAGAIAFRAVKMSLSLRAKEAIIKKLDTTQDKKSKKYAVNRMDDDLFHLLPKIEINPSNAHEFFEWRPMGLEDLETFLGS